jgi:hypothetical protein
LSFLGENQQLTDRSSPVNGPGLAKPIGMTNASRDSGHHQRSSNNAGKKRVDAALEKNIERMVTQVRRTSSKPSQLTQNDLELFDSTVPTPSTPTTNHRNGHHSRETTPNTSHKQSSSSSREMTPDSINTDSANEDHHHRSIANSDVDLTVPAMSPYGPQGWPPAVYPFAHQHPALYLPYPPAANTSTPTNGLPAFYPPYDPLLIEQHYGPQGLSAFYNQHQSRLLQENATTSGMPSPASSFRESQSSTDLFNHSNVNLYPSHRLNPQLNEQQQRMLSQLYLNQIASLPYIALYDHGTTSNSFRSNGDIGERQFHRRTPCCTSSFSP